MITFELNGTNIAIVVFASTFAIYCLARIRQHRSHNTGEAIVRRTLAKYFSGERYHLMNNLTLPFQDGTTQIDHVLVSRTGVFVIETKHYSGWIFGDKNSRTWTQVIFKLKNRFQNPLHQNRKHETAIRKLLDFLPSDCIRSAVVFTGDAEFKSERPEGVFSITDLVVFIDSFQTEVLSDNRLQFCVGRLETTRRLISDKTDVEHQAYLERKFGNIDKK